jgi:acetyl esterase/lipase
MTPQINIQDPIPLWPNGAPGAMGTGKEDCPRLTPYLPSTPTSKPLAAVIVCPGGGYSCRAPHEGGPISRWLVSQGLVSFVLNYRVSPYRHPIPLGDAQRAIRLVRANAKEWNVDPNRIGILGFSAGGHLATSAATIFDDGNPTASDPIDRESCRPNALIACYPVVTFGEFRHHGSMINLIGENYDPKMQEYLSLENRVTDKTPPSFLWHTSDDQAVPVENSLLFAMALRKHKVPCSLHVFPHGAHGLGLAQNLPTSVSKWTTQCEAWLKEINFISK